MSARDPDRFAGPCLGRERRRQAGAGGEEGAPMRVLVLDPAGGSLARCAGTDGIPRTVETALVGQLDTGAVVLVQAGVALVRLDAEWAL